MTVPLELVFYQPRKNQYGVLALLGALDTDPRMAGVPVVRPKNDGDLVGWVRERSLSRRLVVAFSFTIGSLQRACDLARRIREVCPEVMRPESGRPGVFLVAGGACATGMPEVLLARGFDAIGLGEGEATFLEFMQCWLEERDWRKVAGMAWRNVDGGLVRSAARSFIDLDMFPPFPLERGLFGHIEITRGCPFGCQFCQTSWLHGFRARHRSLDRVVETAEAMMRANRRDLRFITPNGFGYGSADGRSLNLEAVESLLRAMRETAGSRGRVYFGTFPSEVRPEHVVPETVELLRRFTENRRVLIGAQSGSDRMLEYCRRGHDVGEILRAAEVILQSGLGADVDFIFGLPGETDADRKDTVVLMDRLAQMGARVHTHTFIPLPGTGFAGEEAGRIHPDIQSTLNRLIPRGSAFGNWREQAVLTERLFSERGVG